MSALRSARSADLAATAAATVFAVFVALLADSGPLVAVALLPLVLILPGYALAALLFPPETIDRELRIVMVASLSIAATALSGLILQLVVDLSRGVVVTSLAALTIGAAILASRERERRRDAAFSLALPRISAVALLAIAAAVSIAGVAIAIATGGAERQLSSGQFSSLWLVPKGGPLSPPDSPPVVAGVSSQQHEESSYRLTVQRGGSTVGTWSFSLPPGGEWERTLEASELAVASGPLVAKLDRGGELYRRVAVELDSRSGEVADG